MMDRIRMFSISRGDAWPYRWNMTTVILDELDILILDKKKG
jgi:hypothetical protein